MTKREADTNWNEEYDVVAVGSGAGSLAAAIVAAEAGARVLVVEKYHQIGGVTALSAGQVWLGPNSFAQEAGIKDSAEEVEQYIDYLSAGFGSQANRRAYIGTGNDALLALCELGLRLQVIRGMEDYYFPQAPGSKAEGRYLEAVPFDATALGEWEHRSVLHAGVSTGGIGDSLLSNTDYSEFSGDPEGLKRRAEERKSRNERSQGAGIAANLISMAIARGVEFRINTAAVDLIGTDRVEGLVLQDESLGRTRVRAVQGVVLGTGGYDWNPELIETYEYLQDMKSVTLPTVTGDHLKITAKLGAAVATTIPMGKSVHYGVHVPGETWGGAPMYRHTMPGLPHSMVVNQAGKRFADEAFFHSYVAASYTFDGDRQVFPNWPAWLIFDSNYRNKYAIGPIKPGEALPDGMAVQADTLEELGQRIGVDAEGLAATTARFNSFCRDGVDHDFGRGRPWSRTCLGDPSMPHPNLGEITLGPFYAIKFGRVGTGLASAGLKTTPQAQVVDLDNAPIPGLYAVGNSATRIEFGGGYNSGMAVGRSLVFGYAAGKSLMGTPPHVPESD